MKGDIPYADPNYEVNKDFFGNLFKTMGECFKRGNYSFKLNCCLLYDYRINFYQVLPKKKLIQIGIELHIPLLD